MEQETAAVDERQWLGAPRSIWALIVAHKVALYGIALMSVMMVPGFFSNTDYNVNYHWLPGGPTFWSRFTTWDGNHYLEIANHGYKAGGMQAAFFPLWPGLVRAFWPPGGPDLVFPALTLSMLFSGLAEYVLYRFVRARFDARTAMMTVLCFLAFPGRYVDVLPYSEGIFLLCFAGVLYGLQTRNAKLLAVSAFFLPIARSVGATILVPIAVDYWQRRKELKPLSWAMLIVPLLGLATTFTVYWAFTGNPFENFRAANMFASHPNVGNLYHPDVLWRALVSFSRVSLHNHLYSPLDRLFFLASVWMLWLCRRDPLLLLTAGALVVLSAGAQLFVSYIRYMGVIIPLFIGPGVLLARAKHWGWLTLLLPLFALELLLLLMHINNYWTT